MRSWTSAALLPVGLCLVGLGLAAAPLAANAQVELSMSAWVPPSHMLVRDGMVPWMQEVEKVTEGRVKVKLLPKPVTNPINHFDAVRDGLADVASPRLAPVSDRALARERHRLYRVDAIMTRLRLSFCRKLKMCGH